VDEIVQVATISCGKRIDFCSPVLASVPALAQGGLKVIDNPGGGQVIYGPVANQTTPQGTKVSVPRYIHSHFGNRPQVGNIFEGRDSQTFGSFFLVTAKSGNQAGKPLAGLVLIPPARRAAGCRHPLRRFQPLRQNRAGSAAQARRGLEDGRHSVPLRRWQRNILRQQFRGMRTEPLFRTPSDLTPWETA
jgi:hypothetical protein